MSENNKQIIVKEVKPSTDKTDVFSKYTDKLWSPQGLMLAGGILVIIALQMFSGGKKGKLATSYWGGSKETASAKKKALKQIISPKCDSASLYIGVHKYKGMKPPKGSGGTPLLSLAHPVAVSRSPLSTP
jgi:hypothetical protein